jgi:hypothetical protein
MKPPGSKEAQLKALRERRDPAPARPAAQPKETDVKNKVPKAKRAPKKRTVPKLAAAAKKTAAPRQTVSAQAVADFVSRPGGASIEELTKKFGIEAHPMRAKIYNVRHTLGYAVEVREGRYYGTPPAAS